MALRAIELQLVLSDQQPDSPFSPSPPCSPAPAVIKDFCKQLGADTKQVQGLIRLAKKNGEKLGFLA